MQLCKETESMEPIYDVLRRLGITANYLGFYYAAYAVWLCVRQPEALFRITRWLYPSVAEHYQTSWKSVERDLRTVIDVAWRRNPEYLSCIAGCALRQKPGCAQFLSILSGAVTLSAGESSEP